MKIFINNFQTKLKISPKSVKKAVLKTLAFEKLSITGSLSISFVNDSRIKKLNAKYHNSNTATDVLAFNITGPHSPSLRGAKRRSYRGRNVRGSAEPSVARPILKKKMFADIIVSTDTAIKNAKIYKTTPDYELHLYVIHGLLHLSGYNDQTNKERLAMQKKAENILKYASH